MNPFKTLATAMAQFIVDFKAKMNPVLASLPPVEQIEATDPVISVLRTAKWAMRDAEEMSASFGDKVAKVEEMLSQHVETAKTEALSAAIAEKKVVLFEDHETAITAAEEKAEKKGKDAAEVEFNAKLEGFKLLSTRRQEVVSKVGDIAASALTDEDLLADNHAERISAVEARVTTLKTANITPESKPKVFADLMAAGMDEAVFTARFETLKEAAGGSFSASVPDPARPTTSVPVVPGVDPARKRHCI